MKLNPPRRVRAAIYVANLIGTPVIAYALAKGWIGSTEVTLWGAEVTAAFALAGLNLPAE
ncbi:MAG: hypothetical protein ACXVXW_09830 [Mycobacteriaceae bacterium]